MKNQKHFKILISAVFLAGFLFITSSKQAQAVCASTKKALCELDCVTEVGLDCLDDVNPALCYALMYPVCITSRCMGFTNDCNPGSQDRKNCSNGCYSGAQFRTCDSSCEWGDFGDCNAAPCPTCSGCSSCSGWIQDGCGGECDDGQMQYHQRYCDSCGNTCDTYYDCRASASCAPPPTCPNGTCGSGENCSNCPADCGACCGNGTCSGAENCSNCAEDCGSCPPGAYCGDGSCNNGEDCSTCSDDCGSCSGTCTNWLDANPLTIPSGGTSTISWGTNGLAALCWVWRNNPGSPIDNAESGWGSNFPTSGSKVTDPMTVDKRYVMYCSTSNWRPGCNEYLSKTVTISAATCNNNGIKDNGEAGIDCGGGSCPACECYPGDRKPGSEKGCGNCGLQAIVCGSNNRWGGYEACVQSPTACTPGSKANCSGSNIKICGNNCVWGNCYNPNWREVKP